MTRALIALPPTRNNAASSWPMDAATNFGPSSIPPSRIPAPLPVAIVAPSLTIMAGVYASEAMHLALPFPVEASAVVERQHLWLLAP